MKTLETFIAQSGEIISSFNQFISTNNLQDLVVADHICYKCGSKESFEEWRKMFEWDAKNIFQSIISKRRIAIVTFKEPILTAAGPIKYLELSDQKPDNSQMESFDHIEIISKNGNFDEMKNKILEKGIKLEINAKPHHTTYDLEIGKFSTKLSQEFLVDKIKKEEFI
jgi:predicted metalloenzyme YecM